MTPASRLTTRRQTWLILAVCTLCALIPAMSSAVEISQETFLPLGGKIAQTGRAVWLEWPRAKPLGKDSRVAVSRRPLGSGGMTSWKGIAPALGPVKNYNDATTRPGIAYEYQVERYTDHVVDVGYWTTGAEVPAIEHPGDAIVVVDRTVADAIGPRLKRFLLDLAGEGWTVTRLDAPRSEDKDPAATLAAARALKKRIEAIYRKAPDRLHALILMGHVPVVHSGMVAPDGHRPVPVPTDLFYADMNGDWPDNGQGVLRPDRVPGDGIELQVGRIDFAPASEGEASREVALLRAYLDKDHHWRQDLIGDLRQAYGQNDHLLGEQMELRNIVGPRAITKGGHADAGPLHPWLWGVDFGSAAGKSYPEKYSIKAVFAINFGSHKQIFDRPYNPMTELLAQPFYPIAVGWGGRPTWWIEAMALGRTIGDSHMRTVNNGRGDGPYQLTLDYYPTGRYVWRNPVWVNLLGDPTTHAFPLEPPHTVSARPGAGGMRLSWTAPTSHEILGYKVYRAGPDSLDFTALTPDPITETEFTDPNPVPGAWYMVRAYGLKKVYGGSFYTYSQGAFAWPGHALEGPETLTAATTPGTPVSLTFPNDGVIRAFIQPPGMGELVRSPDGWLYTPPDGFTGQVAMDYSRFDEVETTTGRYTVSVR